MKTVSGLSCGACNLCCKVLHVPDINKPSGTLCWWTGVHGGCQRHAEKETAPELAACAQWRCVWLDSQNHENPLARQGRHMRPDQVHVVLGPQDRDDPGLLYVQVDPAYPQAWQEEPISSYLTDLVATGARLEVIIGQVRFNLP
jgi:uncharacterized protein